MTQPLRFEQGNQSTRAFDAMPHNLEAERAVLGACLTSADAFALAAAVLTASDFYRVPHRVVFSAMHRLVGSGQSIDLVTLKNALTPNDLEAVGGPVYLASLVDGVPRSTNVSSYAEAVREQAERRSLLVTLRKAATSATDSSVTPRDVAASVTRDLQSITLDKHPAVVPAFETLRERLTKPVVERPWLFENLQQRGDRALLTAQFKAGKTSLVGNLARSYADAEPFLGAFRMGTTDRTLVILDFEMSAAKLDGWYRDMRIVNDHRVILVPLRGRASSFNILNPTIRSEWATRLREVGAGYLVVDCLRPILDALGLDEHREAGRFLVPLDALIEEADVADGALLVHHMGHTNERSRGDSRLRDWPDAELSLVRKTDESRSPRFFRAYGRDVDIPESALAYDEYTRRLTLVGGSRKDAASDAALADVVEFLAGHPDSPQSGRAIADALRDRHPREVVRGALARGQQAGTLVARNGAHRATLYQVSPMRQLSAPVRRSAPPVSQNTASQCAVLYRDGALAHSITKEASAPEVDSERI